MMIFVVEDDAGIRDMMCYTLTSTGFEARGCCDGGELTAALREQTPQLVLLDIMLPGEDGLSILKRLRADPKTESVPVIMATAKGAEYDKITGLDLGADDYLSKPFGMMEMVSRVRAVLRRTSPKSPERILKTGGLRVDVGRHSVECFGQPVVLTLKEFEVLRLLLESPGMVFTRDMLLEKVWGMDYDGETRTVDVHIRTLRGKLGPCGEYIETVRGLGYRMEMRRDDK